MQQNGEHVELKQSPVGNMMGRIPSRLGVTAIVVFGMVFALLVVFAAGFKVRDVMEVPMNMHSVSPGEQYTLTASVAKSRVGKIKKGDKVELNVQGMKTVFGVVDSINMGPEEGYVTIKVPQLEKPAQELLQKQQGILYGKIVTGKQSMMEFFFR